MGAARSRSAVPTFAHVAYGTRPDGMRWVRTFKITHPTRCQKVLLVSVPRIALKSYYADWCYVPYLKSSVLGVISDIDFPALFQSFAHRFCIDRDPAAFADYDTFHVINQIDPVDSNVTRREAYQRYNVLMASFPRLFFLPTQMRDWPAVHKKYVTKRVQKLLGSSHLYRPGAEFAQSYVILAPPTHALAAINALEEMGFVVVEAVEHDVGDDALLQRAERAGYIGNVIFYTYLWALVVLVVYAGVCHINEEVARNREPWLQMKREMIERAERASKAKAAAP